MKRILLVMLILALFVVSNATAKDYGSKWLSGGESGEISNQLFVNGFLQGISWSQTIEKSAVNIPSSEMDVRQRMMTHVVSNIKKIDYSAAERVMSTLYKDPANAQLHPSVVFFAAAGKLLGFSEEDVAETLRLFRSTS